MLLLKFKILLNILFGNHENKIFILTLAFGVVHST